MGQGSDTVSLRITLRYKNLDEFVDRYAENVSSAGLFIRTKSPKATGTKIRFELLLADGSRALKGEGVVVTVRKEDKPGMALRFNLLDDDSQQVVDRLVAAHGQGALAPTPLSTTFARAPSAGSERRPASIPGWRPTSVAAGWSKRSSSVLPRSPSKTFERDGSKPRLGPPRRAPSGPGLPKGPALPRKRSSAPRPWASSGAFEQTDKIRLREQEANGAPEGAQDPKTERIATPAPQPSNEPEKTERLDVSRIEGLDRSAPDRGDTILDPPRSEPPDETPVREPIPRGESLTPEEIAEAVLDTARSMADEHPPRPRSLADALADQNETPEAEHEQETALIPSASDEGASLGAAEIQMPDLDGSDVSAIGIDARDAVFSPIPREAIADAGATTPDAEAHPGGLDDAPPHATTITEPDEREPDQAEEEGDQAGAPEPTGAEVPEPEAAPQLEARTELSDDAGRLHDAEPPSLPEDAGAPGLSGDAGTPEADDAEGPELSDEAGSAGPSDDAETQLAGEAPGRPSEDAGSPEPSDDAETRLAGEAPGRPSEDAGSPEPSGKAETHGPTGETEAPESSDEAEAHALAGEVEAPLVSDEEEASNRGAVESLELSDGAAPPAASDDAGLAEPLHEPETPPEGDERETPELSVEAETPGHFDDAAPPAPSEDAEAAVRAETVEPVRAEVEAVAEEDWGTQALGETAPPDSGDAQTQGDERPEPPSPAALSEETGPIRLQGDEEDHAPAEAAPQAQPEAAESTEGESDEVLETEPPASDQPEPQSELPPAPAGTMEEPLRAEAVATTEAVAETPLPLHPVEVDWSGATDPEERDEDADRSGPPDEAEADAATEARPPEDEGEADAADTGDLPAEPTEEPVDTADTGDLPAAATEDAADTGDLPAGSREDQASAEDTTAELADTSPLGSAAEPSSLDASSPTLSRDEESEPTKDAVAAAPQDWAAQATPEPPAASEEKAADEPGVSETKDLPSASPEDRDLEAPPIGQEETLVGVDAAPIPAASRSEAQEAIAAATSGLVSAPESPSFHEEKTDSQEVRPQPAYLEAETVEHVKRPDALSNVSLDAATEIVSAYDATAPEPSVEKRSMISTEVSVTGMEHTPDRTASSPNVPAARRPSRPRIAPHRTIVEKDASQVPDPAEELKRAAREAAFSEEATLVPPERRAQEDAQVVVSAPDEAPRTTKGSDRIVGIDLGARWVRIGFISGQEFELIPAGDSVHVPALVAVKRDGTLAFGTKARAIALEEPNRAVSPRAALHALATGAINPRRAVASRIISYEGGSALLQLGERTIRLQELLVEFFGWLGAAIRQHLDAGFRAVVSVPNDLDPEARMMLKRACTEAGLRIARLESEPNAAVRAFNLVERSGDSALIVDLGATHLGISVMKRSDDEFIVAASEWFDDVSARDLDAKVADLTLAELREQAGEDHSADPSARERLIEAAEHARLDIRRAPTLELKVTLPAPGGASGVVVERTINLPRNRIYAVTEELIIDVCSRTQQVLRDAGIDPRELGAVLLAGSGGTYPPLIEALQNLTTLEPLQGIPPTHLFAQGLARRGMVLERQASADLPNTLSASIGLELPGGRFRPLLNAGDRLPARLVRPFPTRDGQTEIDLRLFQGDAELVRSCTRLGFLNLPDIPRSGAKVELEMRIDLEGILDVTLREETSGLSEHIRVATQQTPEEKRKALPKPTAVAPDAGVKKKPSKGGLLSRLFGRR